MSGFNFDAFRPVRSADLEKKMADLAQASADKKAALAAKQAPQQEDHSWSTQLGLDGGSFLSNRVNDAASLVSGTSRLAGDILTLPGNTFAALASDPKESAYLRDQVKDVRNFFDLGGIVEQTNRNELNSALGENFENEWSKVKAGWKDGKPSQVVSGIAGLLMNAGEAVVTNPSAAREYIIENAPQLLLGEAGALGKAGMLASNVGYAADNYRTGLEEYAKQHGGAMPPEEERTRMAILSATLAAAEQAGDMFGLSVGKVKGAAKAVTGAAEGAAQAGEQAAVKAGLLQSLKRTGIAAAEGGAEETATEGYQSWAEGEINQKTASALDIYTGGVIGGVAGAGLSGGIHGLAEVTKSTPEHVAERVQTEAKAAETQAKVEQAVSEGKPEAFLDTTSPDYSPAKAVEVLHEMAKKDEVKPEEVQQHVEKSGEIISKMEDEKAKIEDNLKTAPEQAKEIQNEIKDLQDSLVGVDPNASKDSADYHTEVNQEIATLNDRLVSLTDKDQVSARELKLKEVTQQLEDARAVHHDLVKMANPTPVQSEVNTHIENANSTDVKVASKAGDVLLNLSMSAPDTLDPSAIKTLVDNKNNGLSAQQRDVLRKFSDARTLENQVKKQSDVSQEVLFGQKKAGGNIGIAQYRQRIGAAMASNNQASAERNLSMLGAFAQSHVEKLRAIAKADVGDQIVKQDGKWIVNTGKRLNDKQRRENGAVNIHENSGKLIKEIQTEAKALKAAHASLSAAIALHFKTGVVQSTHPTAVTPSQNISSKKTEEETARLNDKPVQRVVAPPQEVSTKEDSQAQIDQVNNLIDDAVNQPSESAASPQSQPASPIAADAAQATVAQSAPASVSTKEQSKPEATQQQAAVSEANPAPVAEVATAKEEEQTNHQDDDVLADHGVLSVMASRLETKPETKMQELFNDQKLNLIAQFFKQKAKIESTGGHRVLIAVRNFLSNWTKEKIVAPSDFIELSTDPKVRDKQKAIIKDFAAKAKVWNEELAKNLAVYPKDDGFKLRDMMQYMLTKNGDKVSVDENVLTAMSFGMYHWLVNESTSTGKTEEQLNRMHGRDKDGNVGFKAKSILKNVANIEDTAAYEMGEMAVQALGLTTDANAPQDLMPRLKAALGERMLLALASQGYVERRPINTQLINDQFDPIAGQKIDPQANTMYVFAEPEKLQPFADISKGTKGVLDKLFGSERTPVIADTKPAKFRQEFAQNTRQKVPAKLAKILNEAQKVPHTVIPDMWSLMGAIGYDNVLKVAGAKEVDTDFIHEVNKDGVEAKKRGLKNQLDLALDMLGADDVGDVHADITTPRYVQYEVWKNFRVGVLTESLNQQASKIHRYMFARPSWTQKINLNDETHVDALKIAIAAALGIKTDDQPNVDTIALLNDKWNNDEKLRTVVESIHNGLTVEQWSNADLIAEYAADAEGMQTLQALVAYAKLMYADKDHIEVTMLVGADGKTNGPILTQLALGAAYDSNELMDRMARGGIYGSAEGQPKHYSQWRKDTKGKDLYQDLASHLLRITANYQTTTNLKRAHAEWMNNPKTQYKQFPLFSKPMFDAMQSILGNLQDKDLNITTDGRNLVKTPLTAFAFGSSLQGSIKAMENKFIESIYKKIEKLAKEEAKGNTSGVAPFIRSLNLLVSSQTSDVEAMNENATAAMLMVNPLGEQVEEALRQAFQNIMATPVQEAMEGYFATFIERRGDLNRTVQAAHSMYQVAYKAAREKAIKELIEQDHVAWREQTGGTAETGKGQKKPRTDLTKAQEDAVREKLTGMLPVANTAYSMSEGLESGIYMGKQELQLSDDPMLQSQVFTAKEAINGKKNKDGTYNASKTMHVKAMDRVETSPGVAGTPYLIHSLDSFLMHSALADVREALNVHDEIGHGVLEVSKAAGAINRATVNALSKFSPAREALNMLERVATDLAKRIEAGEVSKEEVNNIVAQWKEIVGAKMKVRKADRQLLDTDMVVNRISSMALANAIQADRVRLSTIAKIGVVDQYTWESGQYQVPKQVREQALADINNVVTTLDEDARKAFNTIADFAEGTGKFEVQEEADASPTIEVKGADMAAVIQAVGQPKNAEGIEKVARTMASLDGTGLTPFGQIGAASTPANTVIEAAFKGKQSIPANQAIELLTKNSDGANKLIAQQLAKVLPADLKVQLVTPDTKVEDVIKLPSGETHGWYTETTDGKKVVYLKSSGFQNHGMSVESMLHEMVHAAVAMEIAKPTNPSSKSIVKDLNALLEHLKDQPGAEKFDAIFKSEDALQEMVAWGMSNPAFQEFLRSVKYTASKTTRNKLVIAMKAFTSALSKLLFRDTNETKERALSVLINNVSGLMQQAGNERASRQELMLTHATPAPSYSTADIYNALGQNANNPLSPEDDLRLRTLMSSLIETFSPIYGAFGKDAMSTNTLGAASIWANAKVGGNAPFALDAVAHGLAGNEQVAFMLEQVEATMRAVLSGPDGVTSVAYKELTKLHEEARTKLKDQIGTGLTQAEYDFLFDLSGNADGKSDYLSRFAALGLVNPKINALLQFKTKLKNDEEFADNFLGRLNQVMQEALQWVVGRWTKTRLGEQADSKLDTLATQLVMIEAKRRARLNVESSAAVTAVEEVLKNASDAARSKVQEMADSKFFKEAKSGYVKMVGSVTSAVVGERLDFLAQAYQDFSDQHFHHSNGLLAGLVNEIRGSNAGNRVFYELLRAAKLLEGKRKDLIAGTSQVLIKSFAEEGKHLEDEDKKAISNVVMRTDMQSLMSRYDLKELHALLTDKSKLAKAIVDVTAELASSKHQVFYMNSAKALGYQMATGRARTANNLQNAHSIARLYGTKRTGQVTEQQAAGFQTAIDHLASLYALSYTDPAEITRAGNVMTKEMERDTGNGIEMTLKLHQRLLADSKDRLFQGQEALMMKGYTPEIYNPYIEVQLVSKDDVEEMKDQGFGGSVEVRTAAADPDAETKFLMARHGSGLQPYQTGSMSLTSMNTKGTTAHNGVLDLFTDQGQYNVQKMAEIAKRNDGEIEAMFNVPIEPDQVDEPFLVPVLNPDGKVVNYRYMMESSTKDNVLDRDNRFDKLMGTLAGSIYDKESTPKQNRVVVEALLAQYQKELKERPRSFIEVGPRSADPEMREIYRLLPQATKDAIREVWKSDTMHVRIDLLDMTFGYRKLSITDVLKKDRDARQGMEKLFGDFLSFAFTGRMLSDHADPEDWKARESRALVRARNFEEMWQWLVKEAKDIVVVKNVSTLIGNMTSNISLLYGFGVPVTEIIRQHRIAFRGAVAYKRDSKELFALQTKLDTGTSGSVSEDKARVAVLKDALARNPVHELIQAGLMPTIVDDVELDDDIYSFQSKFSKRVDDLTSFINPDVKAVAQQLYMGHDTHIYQMLSQAAQISDFLGRYTLYQHMTAKKKDPLSKADAIQLASDAFINYDIPTHRKLQYMNDMGFVRFTKYYLRIQKVIMALHRGNPGRSLALVGMANYFQHLPTVMDSAFYHRLGNNPFEAGVFTYPQAIGTLATYKAVTLPFN